MGIICEEVWRDISDYIDDELEPKRRVALERHFGECRHCAAVLEGTCNIILLYRDKRTLAPPKGFDYRLRQRLNQESRAKSVPSRRAILVWALTAAAGVPLGFALFSKTGIVLPRLGHQTPSGASGSPAVEGLVAVSQNANDKVFHVPSCPNLHGKPKYLPVDEAILEGLSPCPICIGKRKPEKKG